MYNAEIKERFVEEFSTATERRRSAVVMFNTLESYEEQWGADVCTVSKEKLQPVVDELVGFRASSKKLRLYILKEYSRWCMRNHVSGACDEILKINSIGLSKLKRQMVANPQHLQRYLDCICDKESEEVVDCIHRCYYWLAYGGMSDDDATEVLSSEVDLTYMVVRHKGKEYPIYREAIPAFKNCIKLDRFQVKHHNYVNKVYKDRAKGNELLRGIKGCKSKYTFRAEMSAKAADPKFMSAIDKSDENLKLNLSFYRVWLSGLFYRTYEAERAGMPVDFLDAAEQFTEGKTYNLSSGRHLIGAKQRRLAGEYLEDYRRWKEAYSI